jgi:hypothetical protein
VGGWMDGWVEVRAVLRIAYSNQKWICSRINLQNKVGGVIIKDVKLL